jgi:cullin 4
VAESKETQHTIEIERDHILDAAIVRIMKAKKKMNHNRLVTAALDAVKNHFIPDVKKIKERISDLINKEYMERDESDKTLLLYLA